MIKEKSKANDQLPIAYNLYFVNSNLKSLNNTKLIEQATAQVDDQIEQVLASSSHLTDMYS